MPSTASRRWTSAKWFLLAVAATALVLLSLLLFRERRGVLPDPSPGSAHSAPPTVERGADARARVPAPEVPSEAESVGTNPPLQSIEVRGLLTGEPLASARFAVCGDASPTAEILSDDTGVLTLPNSNWTELEVVGADWRPRRIGRGALGSHAILWLYRVALLRGRVTDDIGTPIAGARVTSRVAGGPPGEAETLANFGWAEQTATALGVSRSEPVVTRADGSFEISAPLMSGLHIHAVAEGWAPGATRVDRMIHGESPPFVLLQLRRQWTVRGRLVSSTGDPVKAGAQVWIRVRENRSSDNLPSPSMRLGDFGVTFGGGASGAELVRFTRVFSSDDQTFEIPVPGAGVAALHVFAPGHSVSSTPLGFIDGSRDEVEIELSHSPKSPSLRVLRGTEPLRAGSFLASDLEAADGFEVYNDYIPVQNDGSVPTDWLFLGHKYYFIVKDDDGGRWSGFVRWRGQHEIDLLKLSMRNTLE